ncbi:MAG: hypothetical protein ACM3KE_02655 [Hyphomicrobiales bacterium]
MKIPRLQMPGYGFWVTIGILTAACAASNVLSVHYQLPARPSNPIPGRVTLAFEDDRKTDAFLTPMARDELENFSNVFALTVSKRGGSGELKGAYELAPLFSEMLRVRLENAGLNVVAPGTKADAEFKFELKEFKLDFGDRTWTATVAYDALLFKNGSMLAKQAVNGSAERVKVIGKTDAEKVLGELLSETINRMDLAGLFKQAGL